LGLLREHGKVTPWAGGKVSRLLPDHAIRSLFAKAETSGKGLVRSRLRTILWQTNRKRRRKGMVQKEISLEKEGGWEGGRKAVESPQN